MSLLKNLRKVFVVDDEKDENRNEYTADHNKNKKVTGITNGDMSDQNESLSKGKVDNKIIQTLFNAIERSNLDGFDYLEFKKSVKSLEKMVVDEATRFKSAFATAKTMGVTVEKLVETADYYMKVLNKERDQFIKAAGEQTTSMVDNRKKEMQLLLKSMADKKEMIQKLQKELDKSEIRLKTIQTGIDKATVKIENTKKNFDVSFNYLKLQIQEDIEKVRKYLK